ncbi:MAG: hypothetical protein HYZ69_00760 [Candidatus Colwellbacteria bacterium]|nr:hypothetical protein [Candidatus Colwellbacteria bacterium]
MSKISKKLVFFILMIVGVFAIGVLFYTFTTLVFLELKPEPNYNAIKVVNSNVGEPVIEEVVIDTNIDTTGWQTYRNEKYGYSLKYPEDWRMDKNSTVERARFVTVLGNKGIADFVINNEQNDIKYHSVKEFIKSTRYSEDNFEIDYPDRYRYLVYSINDFRLINGIKFIGSPNFFEDSEILWGAGFDIIKDNNWFKIWYSIADGDGIDRTIEEFQTAGEEFKKILKTLKFE